MGLRSDPESGELRDVGTCARWKDHPGQHEPDVARADQADHDDAMRVRLVEASEHHTEALDRIADAIDDGVRLIVERLDALIDRQDT